jgi:hypothetical protein
MMKLAAATIVARSYLSYARVLAASFRQHHPDVPFFVLLADEVDGYFDPETEPFLLLHLDQVTIPDLRRVRFQYSQQELSYAATPYLLSYLLDQGFRGAAFLKQESLVTGDMTGVLDLIGAHSIVMVPHLLEPLTGAGRFERELNILQSGIYNVGFLGVSDTPTGRAFLAWWQDRTSRNCLYDVPNGMHFEQRWLDLVPAYFEDCCIVREPGFNVGHWNLPERQGPFSFVRFSGFDPDTPDAITRYSPRLTTAALGEAGEVFRRYARLLKDAGYDETRNWPYAWDRYDNGAEIPYAARKAYRELDDQTIRHLGDPWLTAGKYSFRRRFNRQDRWNRGLRGLATRAVRMWRARYEADGVLAASRAVLRAASRRLFHRPT